jgi:hypothetical protein
LTGLLCILVLHNCINDRWFMFWFPRKAFLLYCWCTHCRFHLNLCMDRTVVCWLEHLVSR